MTRQTKAHSRSPAPHAEEDLYAGPWLTPPSTTEERLQRIEALPDTWPHGGQVIQ